MGFSWCLIYGARAGKRSIGLSNPCPGGARGLTRTICFASTLYSFSSAAKPDPLAGLGCPELGVPGPPVQGEGTRAPEPGRRGGFKPAALQAPSPKAFTGVRAEQATAKRSQERRALPCLPSHLVGTRGSCPSYSVLHKSLKYSVAQAERACPRSPGAGKPGCHLGSILATCPWFLWTSGAFWGEPAWGLEGDTVAASLGCPQERCVQGRVLHQAGLHWKPQPCPRLCQGPEDPVRLGAQHRLLLYRGRELGP